MIIIIASSPHLSLQLALRHGGRWIRRREGGEVAAIGGSSFLSSRMSVSK